MGMPITVDISDEPDGLPDDIFDKIYKYFDYVDHQFSPFKETSEVSQINGGKIAKKDYSLDMKEILRLAQETKQQTNGYFDVWHNGQFNPSGIVKGWAIWQAAKILKRTGAKVFYIDAGGDIQAAGKDPACRQAGWKVGIRNPFNKNETVKVFYVADAGVATSGNYERGQHIYNPKTDQPADEIASLTVIGPNVYEADRFATPAFAMGAAGIAFIESLPGLEGYMIDKTGMATMTSGLEKYLHETN